MQYLLSDEEMTNRGRLASEEALLGCVLSDGHIGPNSRSLYDLCVENKISEKSFTDPRCRDAWIAMNELVAAGKPIDGPLVTLHLIGKDPKTYIGVNNYLCDLVEHSPPRIYAEHYIAVLNGNEHRRRLKEIFEIGLAQLRNTREFPDPTVIQSSAERTLLELDPYDNGGQTWQQACDAAYDRTLERLKADKKMLAGLTTGFDSLDYYIGGLKPGELIVIGARPSVGKSALMMNIARNAGVPVTIFSLEMPQDSLSERMLAEAAQINMKSVAENALTDAEKNEAVARLLQAKERIRQEQFHVVDSGDLDIQNIRSIARRDVRRRGTKLIAIDYLQLCRCETHSYVKGRTDEMTIISQQIKAMAKELKVPVIALSQLNRASANAEHNTPDGCEEPKLADLRDSGAIEQDADVAILLNRSVATMMVNGKEKKIRGNTVNVNIAKNRNGETGRATLDFDGAHTCFREQSHAM